MSCHPSYSYVPTFAPSSPGIPDSNPCLAPVYERHRSRITVLGDGVVSTSLFFRSIQQSGGTNDISVELTTSTFNVVYQGTIVESYPVVQASGAIAILRNAIQGGPAKSNYIEMPVLNFDVKDLRTTEVDGDGILTPGMIPFSRISLGGGEGAPTDGANLAAFRTGPTRTIYIVRTEELFDGSDVTPPVSDRIQQWNGTAWISYCNNVQGACPGEGTC